jgi:hypothetical protein
MSEIHENNESIQNSEANNQHSEPQAMEITNPSLEAGVDRLVEIIDRTVERFSEDPSERSLLREGVANVVRETMQELALAQHQGDLNALAMGLSSADMAAIDMEALTLGNDEVNSTTGSAIDAAARGADQVGTSFVNFTQGLITGTFSAIVQSTIQQMKAYTDMVAELTKSLKDFAADNVSDDAVNAQLAELTLKESVTTGAGAQAVTEIKDFSIAATKPRRFYHLKKLYVLAPAAGDHKKAILTVFGLDALADQPAELERKFEAIETAKDNDGKLIEASGIKVNNDDGNYSASDITTIKTAIRMGLAKNGLNQLRQMARDGMARIVVTEGEINTKLTFSVKSDATANRNSSSLNRSQGGVSATVNASAGWGWGRASASVSGYYDNLSVSTVDEKTISNIQTATEMLGEVRIKFKTDYLPLDSAAGVKEGDLAPIA